MDDFEVREKGFSDDGEDIFLNKTSTKTNQPKRILNMNPDLIEISTPQQLKNGTRMFKCTRTGAHYGSYASGYVRRKVSNGQRSGMLYQLNKTFKPFPDYPSYIKRELLTSEEARLELINRRSLKFKI